MNLSSRTTIMYVVHASQKKSKKGIATPKHDVDLIEKRLRAATSITRTSRRAETMTRDNTVHDGSGNAFAALGS